MKISVPSSQSRGGFTLLELLVVIAIIGILSSVVLASLNSARGNAMETAALQEVSEIERAIRSAHINTGEVLADIAPSSDCVQCQCSSGDLSAEVDGGNCLNRLNDALAEISVDSTFDVTGIVRDPWGSPYILDANQCQDGTQTYLNSNDVVYSAGPDKIESTSGDNILIVIPLLPLSSC